VRDGVDGIIVAALPETDRAERVASAISALVGVEAQRGRMAERAAGDAGRFSADGRVGETEVLYRTLRA
jgi:hypothetical protein